MRGRTQAGMGLALAATVAVLVVACGKGGDQVSQQDTTKRTVAMATPPSGGVGSGSSEERLSVPSEVPSRSESATSPVRVIPDNVTYADAESVFTMGKYEEAKELFGVYVERKPENAFGHYMLGLSAWKSGDLDGAIVALVRSYELSPENAKTVLNLTRVLLEQGRPGDALEYGKKALDLDPEDGGVYRVLGNVYSDLSQPDSAEGAYRVALSKDTQDAWTMNNLGLLLIRAGRYEESLPPLATAVELKPDVAVFQNNLGVALERTSHPFEAAEAYRAAVGTAGGHGKAEVSLARIEEIAAEVGPRPIDLTELARTFEESLKATGGEQEVKGDEPGEGVGKAEGGDKGGVVGSGDKGGDQGR